MLSAFDMFKVGVGPSSSHTVGPMVAGKDFADKFLKLENPDCGRILINIYGSLALTGAGHGTMYAILSGLEGNLPSTVDIGLMAKRFDELKNNSDLLLGGKKALSFNYNDDVTLHMNKRLAKHSNGLSITLFDSSGVEILKEIYYSIGGGFIKTEAEFDKIQQKKDKAPFPFKNWKNLTELCKKENLSIADLIFANELSWRTEKQIQEKIEEILRVMKEGIDTGCSTNGYLPGGIGVKRRAPNLLRRSAAMQATGRPVLMPWAVVYAFAIAEENAAGGRVITAPTNGSAGVIPAVLMYYKNFFPNVDHKSLQDFIFTAAAIGMLYQMNASISGAEVGCQGEIGVACSMAAGAFCAVQGGNISQIGAAAEMGMEHNLGLTCDPVGGLVQVPCVERNGLAAERAISCANIALMEDGSGYVVSLDQIIDVMYQTGLDMQDKYKETSLGGLAVTLGQKEC